MNYRDRIGIDPAIRSGKPTTKNTRITVSDILEYLAGGMSRQEILADFPDLTVDDTVANTSRRNSWLAYTLMMSSVACFGKRKG